MPARMVLSCASAGATQIAHADATMREAKVGFMIGALLRELAEETARRGATERWHQRAVVFLHDGGRATGGGDLRLGDRKPALDRCKGIGRPRWCRVDVEYCHGTWRQR